MEVQFTPRRSSKPARFPNTIRSHRLEAGLSQKRLAELVGRGRRAISAWERGRSLPGLAIVFRLAKALHTHAESLYENLENTQKSETHPHAI